MEISSHDWATLETWWMSHVNGDRPMLIGSDSIELDTSWLDEQWVEFDEWWRSYASTSRAALIDRANITLEDDVMEDGWVGLDSWWETYSVARQEDLEELLRTLNMVSDIWTTESNQFEADPLGADWQPAQGATGPIRFTREEDWSFALADLFRAGHGIFLEELFDTPHEESPDNVETEAYLPGDEETTRYEDILVTYPSGGISIEVKIGDTNLQKTVETAALVERHHTGDWKHVLLIPGYQHSNLRETFGEALTEPETGPPKITATPFDTQEIEVIVQNWETISATLRAILQRGEENSTHWAASAYVVCTLIEQRILGLIPKPTVERLAAADDIIHDDSSLDISIGDIEDEISYLTSTIKDTQHE